MTTISITAIVTAYRRIEQTLFTLRKIKDCEPAPDEIIVHVDGNQRECELAVRDAFPEVKLIRSEERVGPGGGRNKLLSAARNEYVASFDDDSYPIDTDYFARASTLFESFPDASILYAAVYHRGEKIKPAVQATEWVSDFVGGGCVYRRTAFLSTDGYVPLPIAYGMEEVDLALRLHAEGGRILSTPWLRVFHDTDLKHHASPEITAGSIANLALLTYLRYPPWLWLLGAGQCCKRIWWLVRNKRSRGVLAGLRQIPEHLRKYRGYQKILSTRTVLSYLELRRQPKHVT